MQLPRYEYGDAELVSFLSDFSHSVGQLGGQQHRSFVASQRDEPGITRAAVPLLARKGVTALSVGVDWASPAPKLPRAFVWRDEASSTELVVAWHNYGYGGGGSGRQGYNNPNATSPGGYYPDYPDGVPIQPNNASGPDKCGSAPPHGQKCNSTLTVKGLKHALALFVSDDNSGQCSSLQPLRWPKLDDTAVHHLRAPAAQTMLSSIGSVRFFPSKVYADVCNIDESAPILNTGPPTLGQLSHYYAEVHKMFPNVKQVLSSTFEEFFVELDKVKHVLPVVTKEIGDTWVDTPPSDPLLAAQFRAVMRARSRCVRDQPAVCNGKKDALNALTH